MRRLPALCDPGLEASLWVMLEAAGSRVKALEPRNGLHTGTDRQRFDDWYCDGRKEDSPLPMESYGWLSLRMRRRGVLAYDTLVLCGNYGPTRHRQNRQSYGETVEAVARLCTPHNYTYIFYILKDCRWLKELHQRRPSLTQVSRPQISPPAWCCATTTCFSFHANGLCEGILAVDVLV